MIKTTYQTPELRDANDNVVQEGAFGKNTALSNSTNDGWIDYVMNDLEALHDTIGDSAPTLDGNGHVVEPANLAIGDEDGVRLKTGYLKTSGGTMTGTLNITQNLKLQDNQENIFGGMYVPASSATSQFLQVYGGETPSSNGGNLQLYGSGQFTLQSKNGATAYNLIGGTDGTLKWRGYELAWKKDYLSLAGGTMTGEIVRDGVAIAGMPSNSRYIGLCGGADANSGAYLALRGKGNNNGSFDISANDGENKKILAGFADGRLTWDGQAIALQKDYLPLTGGTMTGAIVRDGIAIAGVSSNNRFVTFCGGSDTTSGASITLRSKANNDGYFDMIAHNGTVRKVLAGYTTGTLTWGGQAIQTTSDKRKKTAFDDVPDNVLEAWGNIRWQQFKYIEDVRRKGIKNCRYHTGLVAQDVKNDCGEVDITDYGILCYDAENDLWTVRYEEALAMEAAYQRRRADRLEQRLEAIEQRLSALEE